jgi:hypothetical protein
MQTSSSKQWYFVHVLAILTVVTTAIYGWLYSRFDLTTLDLENPPQIPPRIAFIALIGSIALFWFWIRMMAACIRDRPARRAVIWGWVLILGFMFGALAYFIAVWRRAHHPAQAGGSS